MAKFLHTEHVKKEERLQKAVFIQAEAETKTPRGIHRQKDSRALEQKSEGEDSAVRRSLHGLSCGRQADNNAQPRLRKWEDRVRWRRHWFAGGLL